MGVVGERHTPNTLPPGNTRGTRCTGACVGRRTGAHGCGKSRPPLGLDPRIIQSIARRYNDYALRIPSFWLLVSSVSLIRFPVLNCTVSWWCLCTVCGVPSIQKLTHDEACNHIRKCKEAKAVEIPRATRI
jgi:hypothetical protein